MKINPFIYFIVLLIILSSCEKETELDIPRPQQKLVMNGILIANQPIEVYVGKSNYALDTNSAYIPNAMVNVRTGTGKSYTLEYINKGIYNNEKLICYEDSTYKVEVQAPGFEKAEANVKVPQSVNFSDYTFEREAGIGKDGFDNKRLTVSFYDDENNKNYYMLLFEWHSPDSLPGHGYIKNDAWYSYSPVIMAEGSEDEYLFSDKLFNGQKVSIPMNFNVWDFDIYYDINFLLKTYLITVSESYYLYHKSYNRYLESENNIWLSNSPPQIHSNVENALGIFSSVNVCDSIIIEF